MDNTEKLFAFVSETITPSLKFEDAALIHWERKRIEPQIFVTVKIIACDHEDWWYYPFIGYEFFGFIKHFKHKYNLPEVYPCRLTKTKIIHGRDVLLKDCMILHPEELRKYFTYEN